MHFERIPYATQDIADEDIEAVVDLLKSPFLTQGPVGIEFENALCEYTGADHAVSFSSATSALHAACLAIGVKKGDYVWTTVNSFVASANCVLYCGASVDFIDISEKNYNLDISKLESKLEVADQLGLLPKAVIAVHFAGLPCDMSAIAKLASKFGFKIIEDASHAIGAEYKGSKVGSCQYSDITVFSFHPVKIITTGEGGAALTNDIHTAQCLKSLRSHGITRNDFDYVNKPSVPELYYEQQSLGFNYRLTDIQSALGLSQLKRIDGYIQRRNQIARFYTESLRSDVLKHQIIERDSISSFHLFVIKTEGGLKNKRDELFYALKRKNIICNLHYIPISNHPYFRSLGFDPKNYPIAQDYWNTALSIPMFPKMTDAEVEYVSLAINEAVECLV